MKQPALFLLSSIAAVFVAGTLWQVRKLRLPRFKNSTRLMHSDWLLQPPTGYEPGINLAAPCLRRMPACSVYCLSTYGLWTRLARSRLRE